MILLIMLVLFGQVEDNISIHFVETSGSSTVIDGRMRHITYYDEEPGRKPDTTWAEIRYIIDPDCGGAGIILDADGNPLPTYPRWSPGRTEGVQVPLIYKLMLTLIPAALLAVGYWLGYRRGRNQ